jgi:hypothetical protein
MSKNLHGKTREVSNPYLIIVQGDWEWRVLKRYQSPEGERTNPYAVWFCAVKSPNTFGSWDMGDTYIRDIPTAVAGQDFPDGGAVRSEGGFTITTATIIPQR